MERCSSRLDAWTLWEVNVGKALDKVTELIENIRHPPKENCFLQNTFSVTAETE